MSKRVKSQLTKDDFVLQRDELDDRDSEMDTPQKASVEVMANRKIAGMGRKFGKKPISSVNNINNNNNNFSNSIQVSNIDSNLTNDQILQLKSLNANFLKSINDGINKNPVANLKDLCNKYLDYINKVLNKKIEVKTLDIPKVEINKSVIENVETKPNPFAMFARPIVPPAKTSITSIMPTFNNSSVPVNSVTKPITKPEPIKVDKSKSDSDSDNDDDDDDEKIEIKGPSFTSNAVIKDSVFKFGKVPAKNDDDSDSDDEIEIKGPSFTLSGTTVNDSVFKLPKKEENKQNDSQADEPVDTKPAFSFGSKPTETQTDTKPAFSFADKPTDTKSAFSFGSKSTETPIDSKPAFSFGSKSTENTTDTKPAFNFGSKPVDSKSTFNFNENSSLNGFTFGKSSTSESVSATKTTANPFSIGGTTFNAPSTSVFNFQVSAPKTSINENKDDDQEEEEESKDLEKDDVKGNFQVISLTEKIDVKTGEEDEEIIFTKRSKISRFNNENNNYDLIGLGDLKILKNKINGKSRILVRSDGSSNVILNILILKDMKYNLIGEKKNILYIPSPNISGNLDKYIARVKTQSDGENLLKAVESCQ
ncbi:hypothetical protein C6P40_002119 [Pichia californica]|uniref:RanBD1 domain-containing protein n=1 Tax=Pichia californica TaxID=460514 RepID=A0A9P7BHL1_9ASCO|nr:hypothetical protein C6P40_002119 [[Candida] californica]